MTSAKRLFTVTVEDEFSSSEAELLIAANEAANEYSSIYNWTDVSVSRSALPAVKSGNRTSHYFDVLGKGEAIPFDSQATESTVTNINVGKAAAKEVNP